MIVKIKKIKFNISLPSIRGDEDKTFVVEVKDDATFVEALALVDKQDMESTNSIFPIFDGYIHNYLQLFWDPSSDTLYDDIALSPYGPDEEGNLRNFMPIQQNIEFNLFPDSVIDLQANPGS